jgi:hypothetical protein
MGLDFPNSPTVGQIFPSPAIPSAGQWMWDGNEWAPYGSPSTIAAVRYDANQNLSASQQLVARQNIAAPPWEAMSHNNIALNAAMDVNTLGQFSSTYAYGAAIAVSNAAFQPSLDQWGAVRQSTAGVFTLNPQAAGGPAGIPSYLQLTATTATGALAAGDYALILTPIEGYRWQRLAYGASSAAPITVSFWVYSPVSGTFSVALRNWANNRSYVVNVVYVTGGWQFCQVVIPGDTGGTYDVSDNRRSLGAG